MEFVNAHWCLIQNFGDALVPYIMQKVSGKRAVWTQAGRASPTTFMSGGSLLQMDTSNSIVWGCGILNDKPITVKPKEVRSVRGPISRDRLMKAGFQCPEVYGDTALLLPRYYKPMTPERKHPLGIVPHYLDLAPLYSCVKKFKGEFIVIDVTEPPEKVVHDICSCAAIASSSLHGLIVADAYGIPNVWISVTDLSYQKVKFLDYYASVGVEAKSPVGVFTEMERVGAKGIISRAEKHKIKFDADALLEACPFVGEKCLT